MIYLSHWLQCSWYIKAFPRIHKSDADSSTPKYVKILDSQIDYKLEYFVLTVLYCFARTIVFLLYHTWYFKKNIVWGQILIMHIFLKSNCLSGLGFHVCCVLNLLAWIKDLYIYYHWVVTLCWSFQDLHSLPHLA